MSKKPKPNKKQDADESDGSAKPRGSRKMLLVAVALCLVSLSGGFFLARMAYVQDAEAFEPDYKSGDDESEMADAGDGHSEDDGHDQGDGHSKDDGHGSSAGHGKEAKLRKDITDPLAKNGHDAEKAMALQEKDEGGKEAADTGLLDFGDILTNIRSFDAQGNPSKAFLKVSLKVAYRPDEGSGKVMQERQPFMRDLFNGYLRGLTENDVRGMAGILYIKAELLKRARAAVGSDLPQEILISDLIVQ